MKKVVYISILIVICFFFSSTVIASTADSIQPVEFTEEYKKYLLLSDEEKAKYEIIPNPYKTVSQKKNDTNPIFAMSKVGAGNESSFSLLNQNYLPRLRINHQENTNICWAFSTLSSLETHLDLKNIQKGLSPVYYDFSESHMDYGTVRDFLNNQKNVFGTKRKPGDSATWYTPISYLTSGIGAVNEAEMP